MILINLLPYREQEREKQQKAFARTLVGCLMLGVAISAATYLFLAQSITDQNARNSILDNAIAAIKKEEQEVIALNKEKTQLLERKKKIEELQQERGRMAKMVDEIAAVLPANSYLSSLKSAGVKDERPTYVLTGRSTSDSRIAEFMNKLPRTGLFGIPTLSGIQKGKDAQEFVLNLSVAPPGAEPPIMPDVTVEDIKGAVDSSAPIAASEESIELIEASETEIKGGQ